MALRYLLQVMPVLRRLGEQLRLAVVAEDVDGLGVVVVRVLVVAEPARGRSGCSFWQYLSHFLASSLLYSPALNPQATAAAVSGGRSPPAAREPAVGQASRSRRPSAWSSSSGTRRLVDDRLGHDDAGVAGGPQGLHLVIVTEPSSKLPPSAAET